MSPRKPTTDLKIYQLKVTLRESKPPIWRRIQVTSNTNLHRLHQILQAAMGWTDSHLHQFIVSGVYYGEPDPEDVDYGMEIKNEKAVKLVRIVSGPKSRFVYQYDFGDNWEHDILVEKILPPPPGVRYPVCLEGKRACPPEDCGGIWGYAEFLKAIRNPRHSEHEEMLEWVGGEFDPEALDLEEINEALGELR